MGGCGGVGGTGGGPAADGLPCAALEKLGGAALAAEKLGGAAAEKLGGGTLVDIFFLLCASFSFWIWNRLFPPLGLLGLLGPAAAEPPPSAGPVLSLAASGGLGGGVCRDRRWGGFVLRTSRCARSWGDVGLPRRRVLPAREEFCQSPQPLRGASAVPCW